MFLCFCFVLEKVFIFLSTPFTSFFCFFLSFYRFVNSSFSFPPPQITIIQVDLTITSTQLSPTIFTQNSGQSLRLSKFTDTM